MTPYRFFLTHAGYSWNPATETKEEGRRRCAKALADAERRGMGAGLSFDWSIDEVDSSDWSDEEPAYAQWKCVCRDANGKFVTSLGVIDFGRDGSPWDSPYRRVVEAELAAEAIA